jgi:hypothetical protein
MNDNSNVVDFTGVTRLNLDPVRVLNAAVKTELTDVVILGYDKDGDEYFCSSVADGATVLWLMERLKKLLLETPDPDKTREI